MARPPQLVVLTALSALCAAAPAAPAAPARVIPVGPQLWATVNVCDTPAHPNTMGIRGSMPGTGDPRDRLFMRFKAQYFNRIDRKWHNFSRKVDSGWVGVGSGRWDVRQSGWEFTFKPPADGRAFTLRGFAYFQWRRGTTVVA